MWFFSGDGGGGEGGSYASDICITTFSTVKNLLNDSRVQTHSLAGKVRYVHKMMIVKYVASTTLCVCVTTVYISFSDLGGQVVLRLEGG